MMAYTDPPPDLASLAAAYAFGIVRNHPFVDGNKRTAWIVARTFLKLNGYALSAPQEEKYLTVMGLADGTVAEEQCADWVRQRLTQVSAPKPDSAD